MRILVVEDEPRMADVIARGLREESYAVDVAQDGDDGLYQCSINDYDLIVASCARVQFISTMGSGPNLYRSAPHVAVLGLKAPEPHTGVQGEGCDCRDQSPRARQ